MTMSNHLKELKSLARKTNEWLMENKIVNIDSISPPNKEWAIYFNIPSESINYYWRHMRMELYKINPYGYHNYEVGKLVRLLFLFKNEWLPKIIKDTNDNIYPEFEQRLLEQIKALCLDTASKLSSEYTKGKYRKTVQKYKLVPKPKDYPKSEIIYYSEDKIKWLKKYLKQIENANIQDQISPEGKQFIAYLLNEISDDIRIKRRTK